MATTGRGLGGAAQGLVAGVNAGAGLNRNALAQRGQDVQVRGQDIQNVISRRQTQIASRKLQQQQLQLLDKTAEDLAGALSKGRDPRKVAAAVQTIWGSQQGALLAQSLGVDPQRGAEAMMKRIQALATTPQERGTAAGQEAVTETETVLGREAKPEELARKAGVEAPQPVAARPADVFDSNGKRVGSIDLRNADDVQRALDAGNRIIPISVRAGSTADAGITTATQTKAETQISGAKEGVGNLASIGRALEEGTVGAVGALKGVLNVTAAQASPEFFDESRATLESVVKSARTSMLRTVSSDSRFSEGDRKDIFNQFPDLGVFETVENARVKLDVLEAMMIRKLGNRLEETDKTEGPVSGITPERIRELHQKGLLGTEEATTALERIFPDQFGDGG